jgi:chromosomal replication initiator protein
MSPASRAGLASDISAADLLAAIKEPLRGEMSLFAWRGFLEPLMPGDLDVTDDGRVSLSILAPSTFLADWVKTHYGRALQECAAALLGRPPKDIALRIVDRPASTVPTTTLSPTPLPTAPHSSQADATMLPQPADATMLPQAAGATTTWPPLAGPARVERSPSTPPMSLAGRDGAVVPLVPTRSRTSLPGRRLDPRYTFDTFVVGAGCRMAFSAAMNVAERPGARYSPLFIFGSTGLGKTHLLHAIGHEVLARHPQQRVALLSAEQWVNEFIETAHDKRFEAFRKRFRDDVDVLLIDDIQFLAGKSQSQDEFFHTFNALYEAHKQIVVTSDRYPHEIAGLEDRLKTRLQWGLVADVRPPDAETRRQILTRKAVDLGCALPTEVIDFVASSITTSVRALEGALTRLVAWSQLTREPLSVDEAREQLKATLQAGAASPLSVARIIDVVATYHGMRAKDLTGPSRQRQITRARQIAMFLARHHLQMSLPELGRAFGGRDHTTVLASVQKIEQARGDDASLQALLAKLEQTLF